MTINGRLNDLAVPGFPGYDPPFGTKKVDGQPVSSREENENIMLPFKKQRPIVVSEASSVIDIESNLVFDMIVAGISLNLGDAVFRGCRVKILNSSIGAVQVVYSAQKTKSVPAGKFVEFEFTANGWILSSSGSGSGSGDIALPVYASAVPFLVSSDKRKLTVKAGTKIDLGSGDSVRTLFAESDMELDIEALLDTGALQNGKDYYLFLCPDQAGDGIVVTASLTKTAPQGLNAEDVLLIGGFHTLCADVGTGLTYVEGGATKNHPLNGYVAKDILPYSVWCLNHRPFSEPEGMVYIPSLDFWCDIYLQSGSGANTKSAYQGAITRSRQYVDFVEDQFCVKKELLDDGEFAASMLGSNEQTSVLGASESGATSGGAGGRKDTANRRMISVYGVEEGCGSLWQWLRTTTAGGAVGSIHGQTADTPTYGWIAMTTSAYGPYGQAGGKGSFWGVAPALLAGGDWYDGAGCGSRARTANVARSFAIASFGGRGRSRPMRFSF
jgi:hypothetical protein